MGVRGGGTDSPVEPAAAVPTLPAVDDIVYWGDVDDSSVCCLLTCFGLDGCLDFFGSESIRRLLVDTYVETLHSLSFNFFQAISNNKDNNIRISNHDGV